MLKPLVAGSLLLVLLVTGCGPGAKPKSKVNGEVQLDDKPMDEGEISFIVAGEVPETLTVRGGTFQGELLHGEKRVEIRAYREGKIPPTATIKEAPKENYIPNKYNVDSTLKAKVSASGLEPAKYEVTSK